MVGMTDGPFFDELAIGDVFSEAPSMTLNAGIAAVHQSIVGDRLRLPLDEALSRTVTGSGPLAHPALVWNVAIGQSTLVTRNVKANLFYRGLAFHRAPVIGDSLHTTTTVVGLKQNSNRTGRPSTGLAALRIRTVDQRDRAVLDFHRCAMIPLRNQDAQTGHSDDLSQIGADSSLPVMTAVADWDLAGLPRDGRIPGLADQTFAISGGDVVTNAPELARLTLNIAAVHHDASAGGGRRLVYGGHTIAVALAQLSRELPTLAWIPAWRSCDHLAPVYEGDTLRSTVHVERIEPVGDAFLLHLRSVVTADPEREVLDWRFVAVAT